MLRAMLAVAVLAGCADNGSDPAVAECRASARSACAAIGYGDNETCLIAFAQGCSPADAAAANAVCCAADGLPAGSECHLTWR